MGVYGLTWTDRSEVGLTQEVREFELQLTEPPWPCQPCSDSTEWYSMMPLKNQPDHRMQVKPCANISGLYQHTHWLLTGAPEPGPCTEIPLRCLQGPWYDGTGMWMKRHVESMLLSSRIMLWCWQPWIQRALLFWEEIVPNLAAGCWLALVCWCRIKKSRAFALQLNYS